MNTSKEMGFNSPHSAKILNIMEEKLKQDYKKYLWNCYNNGDMWALTYREYTFEEWITEGCPSEGGIKIK